MASSPINAFYFAAYGNLTLGSLVSFCSHLHITTLGTSDEALSQSSADTLLGPSAETPV